MKRQFKVTLKETPAHSRLHLLIKVVSSLSRTKTNHATCSVPWSHSLGGSNTPQRQGTFDSRKPAPPMDPIGKRPASNKLDDASEAPPVKKPRTPIKKADYLGKYTFGDVHVKIIDPARSKPWEQHVVLSHCREPPMTWTIPKSPKSVITGKQIEQHLVLIAGNHICCHSCGGIGERLILELVK